VQSVHGHTTNIQFIQTAVNHHKRLVINLNEADYQS